jgi:deoxyribodipyrimidine photo-lyase
MATSNLLVYLLRRDLRIEDNPIFHAVATDARKNFTYLLPVYHFPARQIEVSGFVRPESGEKSPYPEAKSELGKFWRCGPHRAKFIAESVWDLKEVLEAADSGLEIRVGLIREVLEGLLEGFRKADGEETVNVGAVWMMEDEGTEEKEEEMDCRRICEETGVEFKLWKDEKYFVDEYVHPYILPDRPSSVKDMLSFQY